MSLNEKEKTSHENSHGIKVPLQTPLGISRTSVTSSGLIRPLMSIGSFWCWQKCQHNHYLYHRHHHHDGHGMAWPWSSLYLMSIGSGWIFSRSATMSRSSIWTPSSLGSEFFGVANAVNIRAKNWPKKGIFLFLYFSKNWFQNHKYTNTWLPLWMWENRCRKHQNWLLPTHFRSCQERTRNG